MDVRRGEDRIRLVAGAAPMREPCPYCGGEADPSTTCPRAVDCPDCRGRAGGPCYAPSGHRRDELHASRVRLAESLPPRASFVQYHGTPITPLEVLEQMAGRSFCVSYAAPDQVARCHELAGESGRVMLDNGAFSFWMANTPTDWPGFYQWAERWLEHDPRTWAVIPDVIGGTCEENDRLIAEWPLERDRGAPVWHVHEPLERLVQLAGEWPRVCIGSSGEYRDPGSPAWTARMDAAFNALLPDGGRPPCELHMLRGMRFSSWHYPFASVDSTDVARNHCRHGRRAGAMAERWASMRPPLEWLPRLVFDFC